MDPSAEDFPASRLVHVARHVPAKQVFLRRHILNLPLEITLRIFGFLAPRRLITEDVPTALGPDLDWFSQWQRSIETLLNVSFVCHEWRRICLSAPLLWNTIWISDGGAALSAKTCIKYSEKAPLEITVQDGGMVRRWRRISRFSIYQHGVLEVNYDPPELCHHPLLRLQKFFPRGPLKVKSLCIRSTFPPEISSGWFENPAPALESLVISSLTKQSDPFELRPRTPLYRLPHSLFGGNTSALRKLSLDGVELPWTSGALKNLTSLRI
ncbi:hypothetical protein SCHPADRAFT_249049 [Schizopora paradoxa]|uniref:Uncharacterized protein n=1 Tax=Schizopora paradoxa TaxID=27342 RepID=A0A0H2RVW7_9AGAM|nr:hypothetical protein SCHPADRAFT_249049 [Schizopora paradoxa]